MLPSSYHLCIWTDTGTYPHDPVWCHAAMSLYSKTPLECFWLTIILKNSHQQPSPPSVFRTFFFTPNWNCVLIKQLLNNSFSFLPVCVCVCVNVLFIYFHYIWKGEKDLFTPLAHSPNACRTEPGRTLEPEPKLSLPCRQQGPEYLSHHHQLWGCALAGSRIGSAAWSQVQALRHGMWVSQAAPSSL